MSVVADFAYRGEDLLNLAAGLARATQGKFDGLAGSALAAITTYTEAAACGFTALAYQPDLTEPQRQVASALAGGFREAVGHIATHFPPGSTVPTLEPLGTNDPTASNLADYFGPNAAPFVSFTPAAQAAIDMLRSDPFELAKSSADDIVKLMAAAVVGTGMRSL